MTMARTVPGAIDRGPPPRRKRQHQAVVDAEDESPQPPSSLTTSGSPATPAVAATPVIQPMAKPGTAANGVLPAVAVPVGSTLPHPNIPSNPIPANSGIQSSPGMYLFGATVADQSMSAPTLVIGSVDTGLMPYGEHVYGGLDLSNYTQMPAPQGDVGSLPDDVFNQILSSFGIPDTSQPAQAPQTSSIWTDPAAPDE